MAGDTDMERVGGKACDVFGEYARRGEYRGEFMARGEVVKVVEFGCLDAAECMPAGACHRYEYAQGTRFFAAQTLYTRGQS